MKVKCIKDYFDLEMNRAVANNEEFEVSDARARKLSTYNNKAGIPLVKIIEDKPINRKKSGAKKKAEVK